MIGEWGVLTDKRKSIAIQRNQTGESRNVNHMNM